MSAWVPRVTIRGGFWMRFAAVLMFPFSLPIYLLLTVPAIAWSACAVCLDSAFPGRVNWWTPLWEGTAYFEERARALTADSGGSFAGSAPEGEGGLREAPPVARPPEGAQT